MALNPTNFISPTRLQSNLGSSFIDFPPMSTDHPGTTAQTARLESTLVSPLADPIALSLPSSPLLLKRQKIHRAILPHSTRALHLFLAQRLVLAPLGCHRGSLFARSFLCIVAVSSCGGDPWEPSSRSTLNSMSTLPLFFLPYHTTFHFRKLSRLFCPVFPLLQSSY